MKKTTLMLVSKSYEYDAPWYVSLIFMLRMNHVNTFRCVGSVESDSTEEDEEEIELRWSPPKKKKKKAKRVLPKKKKIRKSKKKAKEGEDNGAKSNKTYFCDQCQITFYKEASYKQHMRSSRKAHHVSAVAKAEKEVYECLDCKIAFKDRAAQVNHLPLYLLRLLLVILEIPPPCPQVRHMLSEHNSRQRAFHCAICDVLLKNESAFKSHNSKLHLQRSRRTYYCRVCDRIFGCRLEHRAHIKTHRDWAGEEPGLQVRLLDVLVLLPRRQG